jgi:outer membrane protein assembly factor BamB
VAGEEQASLVLSPPAATAGVVAHQGRGRIRAFDAATGRFLWEQADGPADFGVLIGVDGVFYRSGIRHLAAFDAVTGSLKWAAPLPSSAYFTTPFVDGTAGLIVIGTEDATVRAFDLATGAPRWSVQIAVDADRWLFEGFTIVDGRYLVGGGRRIRSQSSFIPPFLTAVDLQSSTLVGVTDFGNASGGVGPMLAPLSGGVLVADSHAGLLRVSIPMLEVQWTVPWTEIGVVSAWGVVPLGGDVVVGGDTLLYRLDPSTRAIKWQATRVTNSISSFVVCGDFVFTNSPFVLVWSARDGSMTHIGALRTTVPGIVSNIALTYLGTDGVRVYGIFNDGLSAIDCARPGG